jgi:prolyl-tRNA editing enzyme YbaK/EbsC (Cys-tRNA(Pro) deacylase)
MTWVEKTKRIVEREGLEAELFEHKEWGKDSKVVSALLKVPLANVIKGIVCFSRDGPLLAVLCGDKRLDLDKLGGLMDVDVRLGKAREVEKLGFEIGGVPAVGSGLRTFVDRKVLAKSYIIGSAGSPYVGIRLKPSDLVRLNKATVADISEEEP